VHMVGRGRRHYFNTMKITLHVGAASHVRRRGAPHVAIVNEGSRSGWPDRIRSASGSASTRQTARGSKSWASRPPASTSSSAKAAAVLYLPIDQGTARQQQSDTAGRNGKREAAPMMAGP
jgi:hypothetical protein